MAVNKYRLERLIILDKLLKKGIYTKTELIKEIERIISDNKGIEYKLGKRSLEYDLQFIRHSPLIEADYCTTKNKPPQYKYKDKARGIFNKSFSEEEAKKLKNLVFNLFDIQDLGLYKWIDSELEKIAEVARDNNFSILQEDQPNKVNKDYFIQLMKGILFQKAILIDYKSFEERKFLFEFHPYLIRKYNLRWFAIGYNLEKKTDNWVVPLDRIQNIQMTDNTFDNKEKIAALQNDLKQIVGVTLNEHSPREKIILKFSDSQYKYVKFKPLHSSQSNNDKTKEITLYVKINYELKSLIHSFGDNCVVIEPEKLQKEIKVEIKQLLNKYES